MKKFLVPLVAAMIAAVLGFAGFMLFSIFASSNGLELEVETAASPLSYSDYAQEEVAPVFLETPYHEDGIARISSGALITYQHYNPITNEFDSTQEYAPFALIGLSQNELATKLPDWRIVSFASYHVRLQQSHLVSHQQFIISEHEGFVAVFYGDGGGLKELTTRPISALAQSEQLRLLEGIHVTGNEELMRALEDFDS